MLKKHLLLALLSSAILFAQNVHIPNTDFKDKLLEADSSNTIAKDLNGNYFKVDTNNDGEIQESEAQQVSYLNLISVEVEYGNNPSDPLEPSYTPLDISDLTGIDSFSALKTSIVFTNDTLRYTVQDRMETSLDITTSGISDDTTFDNLRSVFIEKPAVHIVKNCPNLESLTLENTDHNQVTAAFRNSTTGSLGESKLRLEGLPELKDFTLKIDYLSKLEFVGLDALKNLRLVDNRFLINADLRELTNLETLTIERDGAYNRGPQYDASSVWDINVANLTNLKSITSVYNSYDETLMFDLEDVSGCTSLETLRGFKGDFDLSTSNLANLETLECGRPARPSSGSGLPSGGTTTLNLTGLPKLETLVCSYQELENIDLLQAPTLKSASLSYNHIENLSVEGHPSLEYVDIISTGLKTISANNAPNFGGLSIGGGLEPFQNWEGNAVESLNFDNTAISSLKMTYPVGSYSFADAVDLSCENCSNLTEVFLRRGNTEPPIRNLNLSGSNQIEDIIINLQPNSGSDTKLNDLLNQLDLSKLKRLIVHANHDSDNLYFPKADSLSVLYLGLSTPQNRLKVADFSKLKNLDFIDITLSSGRIEFLNLKNGDAINNISHNEVLDNGTFPTSTLNTRNFYLRPHNIDYTCIDESENIVIKDEWDQIVATAHPLDFPNGYSAINTYCSFSPGGTPNEVVVNAIFDANNDGCDNTDPKASNVTIPAPYGSSNITYFTNDQGTVTIYPPEGSHTFSPQLSQPDLFNPIAPFTVDFATQTSPYVHDICLTSAADKNDLAVFISPITAARPGFNSSYQLTYTNNGNTTLNGDLQFNFDDDYLDLNSASITPSQSATGQLSWNFSGLQPFESRSINLDFTLNTPTNVNFPIQGDDILSFDAQVSHAQQEYTPQDNAFQLNQTVVNSFDPNDKTALEGETVSVDKIGDYIHYTIRFENTGTASAINVVVKDTIDTQKFDINTLKALSASHNYITRVRNQNAVEFIFENINLPFDDANNDGFITFKIKTKTNLIESDIVENDAAIFFDFNHPIITNETTVAFETFLNTLDPNATSSKIEIYPNPVNNILHLNAKSNIESVSIYNIAGQIIQQQAYSGNLSSTALNLGNLRPGTYLIRVKTVDGYMNKKFIKK